MTFGLFAVYLAAILLGVATSSVTRLKEDAGQLPIYIQQKVTQPDGDEQPPSD